MTPNEIRDKVVQAIVSVAPETDPSAIRPDLPLRDQIDLDSMDFLRVMVELHAQTGVDVPEADYGRMDTLASAVDYLDARLARA